LTEINFLRKNLNLNIMPAFTLNRDTDCAQPVTGVETRIWYADKLDWDTFKVDETPTISGLLISTFPAAVAPFLRQLTAPKNMENPFEVGVSNIGVDGKTAFSHTLKIRISAHSSADITQLQTLIKCKRLVVILEKVGISGDGKYVVIGEGVGIEVTEDEAAKINYAIMGGQTEIVLKTGVSRFENEIVKILHVTDDATTLAAITANTVPVV
jgi:hypothetical protein